jgi:CubicO group peptidase (beta-lactamase class C family)
MAGAGGYYKYQWWGLSSGLNDYSFLAWGRRGQFIFVSPRTRLVIVRTGSKTGLDPQNVAASVSVDRGSDGPA